MQRLEYITQFLKHHNDGSAEEIYLHQVQPRLALKETDDTEAMDKFFQANIKFKSQSPFLKEVRNCVIAFERDVMSKIKAVPYWGRNEWAARVEEITFIKALCIECSTAPVGDAKLKDFICRMRDNAKTALIFGQSYNALVIKLTEVLQKYTRGELELVEVVTPKALLAELAKAKAEKLAFQKQTTAQAHQLKQKDDVIDDLVAKSAEKDQLITQQAAVIAQFKSDSAKKDKIIASHQAEIDSLKTGFTELKTSFVEMKKMLSPASGQVKPGHKPKPNPRARLTFGLISKPDEEENRSSQTLKTSAFTR